MGESFVLGQAGIFLVLSGAIGGLLGYVASSARRPKDKDREKAIAMYHETETARRLLLEENTSLRQQLEEGSPSSDPQLQAELQELRAERDRLTAALAAQPSEAGGDEELRADFSELMERYNQLDTAYEKAQAELSEMRNRPAPAAGADPVLLKSLTEEIDDLRLQVAQTSALKTKLSLLESEKGELERELIQVRNGLGIASGPDDGERARLRAQVEELQRQVVAATMAAPRGSEASESERGELIALRALNVNLEQEREELRARLQALSELEQRAQQAETLAKDFEQKVLGFQVAAEEVPNLREQVQRWKLEAARLQGELDQSNPADPERLSQALRDLENTRQAAASQIESLRGDRDRLQASLAQIHVDQSELLNLRAERERLQTELQTLKLSPAVPAADLDQLRSERDRLREDRIALGRQRDQLQEELNQVSGQLDSLRRQIHELEARKPEPTPEMLAEQARLQAEAEQAHHEAEALREQLEADRASREERLEAMAAQIDALRAESDQLRQKVDQAQGVAVESATIIANLENSLAEIERERASAVDPEELQRVRIERDELAARVSALESTLGAMHQRGLELEARIAAPVVVEPPTPTYVAPIIPEPPTPVYEAPVVVETPAPVYEAPVVVETPAPVYEAPVVVEPPTPVYEAPVVVETPAPVYEAPVVVETPAPVYEAPVVAETPAPVDETPAAVEAPKPSTTSVDAQGVVTRGSDDLEEIIGVSPMAAKILREMGIDTYRRLAQITPRDITRVNSVLDGFQERMTREKWREQAKVLHRMKYGSDF